jgi:hypothetical protein
MITDYDGAAVIDADGTKLGHVERTYIDDSRTSRCVAVKMGTLFAKHRLVPLDGSKEERDGLHVPYSQAEIEASPDISEVGDAISADVLDQVQSYYADLPGNTASRPTSREGEDGDATDHSESGEPVTSSAGRESAPE